MQTSKYLFLFTVLLFLTVQLGYALKFRSLDQVLETHNIDTAQLISEYPKVAQLSILRPHDAHVIITLYFVALYTSLPLCLIVEICLLRLFGLYRHSSFILWPGLFLLHWGLWKLISCLRHGYPEFRMVPKKEISSLPSVYADILQFYPNRIHFKSKQYVFLGSVIRSLFQSSDFVFGTVPVSLLLVIVYVFLFNHCA